MFSPEPSHFLVGIIRISPKLIFKCADTVMDSSAVDPFVSLRNVLLKIYQPENVIAGLFRECHRRFFFNSDSARAVNRKRVTIIAAIIATAKTTVPPVASKLVIHFISVLRIYK